MRSIPLRAVSTAILAAAWACSGDGGNVGPNNPPVANFAAPSCTVNVPCAFVDASTDDNGIASREWDFGDLSAKSTEANPMHTYAAVGDYAVILKVTDASGESNSTTHTVSVTSSNNVAPTASFDLPSCTAGTPCGFHSTSTDADGQIASAHWDFGDQGTGDGSDATHTYAAAGTYNVTLTVTDDKGATGVSTQPLTVSPATSQDCTTSSGTQVDCSLGMTQRVTVKITLVSRSCELAANKLTITSPVAQTVFTNLCSRTVGEEYTVKDGTGAPLVFQAGTQLALRFTQGFADPGDPASGDPGIQIQGSFPNWTLNVDDGGNAGAVGEPDFNDAVLSIQATAAP